MRFAAFLQHSLPWLLGGSCIGDVRCDSLLFCNTVFHGCWEGRPKSLPCYGNSGCNEMAYRCVEDTGNARISFNSRINDTMRQGGWHCWLDVNLQGFARRRSTMMAYKEL